MFEIASSRSLWSRLMGQFRIDKTFDILLEHFYWPKMKRDVQIIYVICIACK
jgi:hypothetical protein